MILPLRALTRCVLVLAAAAALPGGRAAPQAAPSPLADDPTLIALAVSLACAHGPEGGEGIAPPDPAPPPAVRGPELTAGNLVGEQVVGTLAELPFVSQQALGDGRVLRVVKDASGALVQTLFDQAGKLLGLQVISLPGGPVQNPVPVVVPGLAPAPLPGNPPAAPQPAAAPAAGALPADAAEPASPAASGPPTGAPAG